MKYDLVIIGGGPAGSAAAVYAARKKLRTAIITDEFGGQSKVSVEIQNWIGTPIISGTELAESLKNHVKTYAGDSLQVIEGERATGIKEADGAFTVETNKNSYETRAILIASGSRRRKLTIPGADLFEGKGVVYCASCDGPLFADLDVIVVGGGNAGFDTAAQLLAYAKSVTLLEHGNAFKADEITVKKVLEDPKMHAHTNVEIIEIKGEKLVKSIVYRDAAGEEKEISTQGVFVEIGQIPNTEYAEGILDMNPYKHIVIDPRTQKTSMKNIWAAGDCTDVLYHQNNIAVGDAVRAIEDIYIELHKQ